MSLLVNAIIVQREATEPSEHIAPFVVVTDKSTSFFAEEGYARDCFHVLWQNGIACDLFEDRPAYVRVKLVTADR